MFCLINLKILSKNWVVYIKAVVSAKDQAAGRREGSDVVNLLVDAQHKCLSSKAGGP